MSERPSDDIGADGEPLVRVMESAGEARLVAVRPIAAGTLVLEMEGEATPAPRRHSLQISEQFHLDAPDGHSTAVLRTRFAWRFLEHACEPNARIHGRAVFATRAIGAGEAVTFNYNTTEWELAAPFRCRCGSAQCVGEIRGYKHLTAAQRAALPHVGSHLVRLQAGSA